MVALSLEVMRNDICDSLSKCRHDNYEETFLLKKTCRRRVQGSRFPHRKLRGL
jgi:hypothetical protein